MRYRELAEAYLTTAEIEADHTGASFPVEVFKNPSRAEFMKAIRTADFRTARGNLYDDGTLLVFYLEEAEHHAVDSAIGGSGNFTRLFLNPTGVTFYGSDFDDPPLYTVANALEIIENAPALQRIYGKDFEVRED
jgi:hypothetical protein